MPAQPRQRLLAAGLRLPCGHRDRQADLRLRPHALDRLEREPVRRPHDLGGVWLHAFWNGERSGVV